MRTMPETSAPNCLPRDWGRGTSAAPQRPTTPRSPASSGHRLLPPGLHARSRAKKSPCTKRATTAGSSSGEKSTISRSGHPITPVAQESPACMPARKLLPNSVTITVLKLSPTCLISVSATSSTLQHLRDWPSLARRPKSDFRVDHKPCASEDGGWDARVALVNIFAKLCREMETGGSAQPAGDAAEELREWIGLRSPTAKLDSAARCDFRLGALS